MGESLLPTLFSTLSPQDCWGAPCTPREGSRESQAPQEGPRGTEGGENKNHGGQRPVLLHKAGPPSPPLPPGSTGSPPARLPAAAEAAATTNTLVLGWSGAFISHHYLGGTQFSQNRDTGPRAKHRLEAHTPHKPQGRADATGQQAQLPGGGEPPGLLLLFQNQRSTGCLSSLQHLALHGSHATGSSATCNQLPSLGHLLQP